jgi:hypothetical protein
MASHIESGMSTYVAYFRQLIDVVESFGGGGGDYRPSNEKLTVPELTVILENAYHTIEEVDRLLPEYLTAESNRHDVFANLPALATRVGAIAKVSNIPTLVLTYIEEVIRKIHGVRHHRIKPDDESHHISVSQVSYNEQVEHLNQLIDLVESQPNYSPVEGDLTTHALHHYALDLAGRNNNILLIEPRLAAARQARNGVLYGPKTGMIDTALAVKEYVKAVFGANSPQYKEVNHIHFHTRYG